MSELTIEESFELPADPTTVWSWLIRPEKVVGCLPGATLEEAVSDETYRGTMTVAVGAVRVVYRGEAVFEEVDDATRTIRMSAEGREKTGSGSARMTMTSRVESMEGGGSRTTVRAEVRISGKMVRFGRGMIQRVAAEVFRDFSACLAEKLGEEGGGGRKEADPGSEGGEGDAGGGAEPLKLGRVLLSALRRWLRELFGGSKDGGGAGGAG